MDVDLLFPEHGVAVEIDGYGFHRQRPVFEADRSRGTALAAHLAGRFRRRRPTDR